MLLSVLVPVYNEEESLAKLIDRVSQVPLKMEILVVDDCSTDSTWDILSSIDAPNLRKLRHEVNKGKGAAVRTALANATGDFVIIQDADLEYDPFDFVKLIEPVTTGEAQVVYGVRNLDGQRAMMRYGNRFLTMVTNLLYGSRLGDMETCYKLLPRQLALDLKLECNRFDLEPEITAKVLRRGYSILDIPISYVPRTNKKLSPWRDGWPAVSTLFKYRFGSVR